MSQRDKARGPRLPQGETWGFARHADRPGRIRRETDELIATIFWIWDRSGTPLQRVLATTIYSALETRAERHGSTKGGIIIPDTAKEKPQEGEVIAVLSSPSMRRMTIRSCNGRNFMSFAPG